MVRVRLELVLRVRLGLRFFSDVYYGISYYLLYSPTVLEMNGLLP